MTAREKAIESYKKSRPTFDRTDELMELQVSVLNALEAAGDPSYASANADSALNDSASDQQRKAWLAIYGPLTQGVIQ